MSTVPSVAAGNRPAAVFLGAGDTKARQVVEQLVSEGLPVGVLDSADDIEADLGAIRVLLVDQQIAREADGLKRISSVLCADDVQRLVIVLVHAKITFADRLVLSSLGDLSLCSADSASSVRSRIREWGRDRSLDGHKVLLVEDSKTDAYLATKYMTEMGLQVLHIDRAEQVLGAIDMFRPDLILSDLHLPGCTGDQMVRVLRQDPEVTMPILLLSSESCPEKQLMAMSAGADGFIRKPLKSLPFKRVLKTTLRRSSALQNRMHRDAMTGLLNRQQFDVWLQRAVARRASCCLAVMDVDHFKSVNDRFGHSVGDEVLVRLAKLLEDGLRSTDHSARTGGEEFGVIMYDCTPEAAVGVLDRIRQEFMAVAFSAADEVFHSSVSIGVTLIQGMASEVYQRADSALYKAKKEGRNRIKLAP
jgi:diguanylate cyclase (GGDEF)-like protein